MKKIDVLKEMFDSCKDGLISNGYINVVIVDDIYMYGVKSKWINGECYLIMYYYDDVSVINYSDRVNLRYIENEDPDVLLFLIGNFFLSIGEYEERYEILDYLSKM